MQRSCSCYQRHGTDARAKTIRGLLRCSDNGSMTCQAQVVCRTHQHNAFRKGPVLTIHKGASLGVFVNPAQIGFKTTGSGVVEGVCEHLRFIEEIPMCDFNEVKEA